MRRVVITGGNGFVGSHITAHFAERGEHILHPASSELSVLDRGALERAFAGAHTVIHNAARAVDWGEWTLFEQVNIQGTRNVLEACRSCGVEQILLTGSCSVLGEEHCPRPKDERAPHNSHYPYFLDRIFPCAMNYYRDSKRDAVDLALAYAREHALNLTVLHPVWVYGERELHTGFYEYLRTVQQGAPAIMGSRRNSFHVVYAGDLAQAYYLVYRAGQRGVREYIVGDPEPVNMDRLYRLFCEAAGLQKPPNLPKALAYPPALVLELAATLRRSPAPPLLTRGRVNMFYDSIAYSAARIRRELGFAPARSLEENIARTVRWYRQEGLL